MSYDRITWLASYPKSGSTWVRMFLNAFITKFPLNLNSAYQFVSLDSDPALLQMLSPMSLDTLTTNEQFLYRPAMLLNILKTSRTKRVCLKTHNAKIAVDGLPVIPLSLSDAAIYLVRDPRDVCISLSKHMNYTIDETIEFMNNIKQGITSEHHVTDLLLTWSKHVESWTSSNTNLDCLMVKYEDLLDDEEKYFIDILEFLQLTNFEDFSSRFEFAMKESSFESLQNYEKEDGFIESTGHSTFFRVGKSGQWKNVLTRIQVDKIKSDHGPMMGEFGYA